jgi:protein gp37
MNKTRIEWCDYTVNPVKGYCPMACPYCYARRMYDRFGWNKRIRYDAAAWLGLGNLTKPTRVFVGSTFELFHNIVKEQWLQWIFEVPLEFPQHTFIFLTKQPQNLPKWSPFPENCWVGMSIDATGNAPLGRMIYTGFDRVKATVKFISFEPLLASSRLDKRDLGNTGINWLIIGSETGNRKEKPPLAQVQEWAKEIICAADEAGIPVFLKNNLYYPMVRREFPKCQ